VDVGANSGWFTVLAASRVGAQGRVVAVEASPLIAERLRENVRRNGLDNVRVVVSAAGREPGEVEVVLGPAEQTSVTKVRRPAGSATGNAVVPCDTLPSLLTDEEIAAARIVKIDVEGAEFDVVAGLGPALARFSHACEFVVEVGPGRGGGSPEDVATLMKTFTDAGYVPYALPNVYHVAGYLMDQVPDSLERITGPLREQTDVVFSHHDADRLPL
jgi:FkbM family methyltransferase